MRLLPIAFADDETDGTTNAWAVVPATAATATTKADLMRVHIVCSNKCFRVSAAMRCRYWGGEPVAEYACNGSRRHATSPFFIVVLDLPTPIQSSFRPSVLCCLVAACLPAGRHPQNFASENFSDFDELHGNSTLLYHVLCGGGSDASVAGRAGCGT